MAKIVKNLDYHKSADLNEVLEAPAPSALVSSVKAGGVIDRESLVASTQAQLILQEAREDAQRVRQEAKDLFSRVQTEMERSKKQGHDEGYQEGLAQGLEMLLRVKELRQKLFADNEKEMLKLIFEIAKKIIGREFSENDHAIMNVIRLALNDAIGEKIAVRLSPKDYEHMKVNEADFLKTIDSSKTLTFREKEDIKPGGCIVETEIGTLDAQLDTQLGAIKKALGL